MFIHSGVKNVFFTFDQGLLRPLIALLETKYFHVLTRRDRVVEHLRCVHDWWLDAAKNPN